MKDFISEYGFVVVAILGGLCAIYIYSYASTKYKEFSGRFIGALTGNYISYDTELTLEQIERGEGY